MAAALTTLQTPPSSVIVSTTRFWSTFSPVMATLRRYWFASQEKVDLVHPASMRPRRPDLGPHDRLLLFGGSGYCGWWWSRCTRR